ncbi:hypothetical protein F5I97DRAFT_1805976, partial [Phlebopus sp. FC_14]
SSQQPSIEFLESLGIKVRDFAYEGKLPAIAPVPRVPRQTQPAPRGLKRSKREWDEGVERGDTDVSESRPRPPRKSRSLERKVTEPLDGGEDAMGTLEGARSLVRACVRASVFPSNPTWNSPPTSRMVPSQFASPDSNAVQTPYASPLNIHVEDTSLISASQLDSESQGFETISYSQLGLSPQLPQHRSSASPPIESGDPFVESRMEVARRPRRSRKADAPKQYELRCRPTSGSPTRARRARRR